MDISSGKIQNSLASIQATQLKDMKQLSSSLGSLKDGQDALSTQLARHKNEIVFATRDEGERQRAALNVALATLVKGQAESRVANAEQAASILKGIEAQRTLGAPLETS